MMNKNTVLGYATLIMIIVGYHLLHLEHLSMMMLLAGDLPV